MGWDGWYTLGVGILVLLSLAFTQAGPDIIFVGGATLLLVAGIISPSEAIAGLSSEGVITVGVMYIVSTGLRETGVLALAAQRVLGEPKTVLAAQVRMTLPVTSMSAFLNNTPIVALWMPVINDWAKKIRISASKLMLPLSYASILGGCCTLIGTSTNLVVRTLLEKQPDQPLIGLFHMTPVALPCAVLGLIYLWSVGRWMLPDRKPVISQFEDPREYTVEMIVEPASVLSGKTIEEAGLRQLPGLFLVEIERDGRILAAVGPSERLQDNDRLVFAGIVESVVELQRIRGLKPATDQVFKLSAPKIRRQLLEAVVSDSCPLVGQTIRDGRFRTVYNAVILGVARNGERIRKKVGDIVLRAGDTLLLETNASFLDQQRNSRDFYLISRVEGYTAPRHDRAWFAGLIFLGLIVTMAWNEKFLLPAAMLAAGLMILTRCCTSSAARRSVDWQVLVAIAASFAIGKAMEKTGVAAFLVVQSTALAGTDPWVNLAVIYFATLLCTELLSNNAAAVLMFPLGVETAEVLGVPLMPFAAAIMLAASLGFATPLGYQTHLMVYGPGGYKFQDFLKIGIPLDLLMGVLAVLLIPWWFPFHPATP
jgi:di/tricarboxylate transporter